MIPTESDTKYKTLRNKLRGFPLEEILLFTWSFDRYLNYGTKLPAEIPNHTYYNAIKGNDIETWIKEGFQPWLLDIILREYITHYKAIDQHNRSLFIGNRISNTVNQLSPLSDSIIRDFHGKDKDSVQSYFWRLQYRQFNWQNRNLSKDLLRYYILYQDKDLKRLSKQIIDPSFDIQKILLIGGLFWITYLNHFWIKWPIHSSEIKIIKSEDIDYFCKTFSKTFQDICLDDRLIPRVSEDFEFKFNPIQRFPLIVIDDKMYCPETVLLVDMITKGLKYIILEHNPKGPINQQFGLVFEHYCYDIANYFLKGKYSIYPDAETKTKDGTPRTVDIILEDSECVLFIECKSGYINKHSDKNSYDKALNQIAEYLEEAYNSLNYYKQNKYPQIKYKKNIKKELLIVLLDDIYMIPSFDKEEFSKNLKNRINIKAQNKNHSLDQNLLSEIPWKICGVKEFEYLIGNLIKNSIRNTLERNLVKESFPILRIDSPSNIKLGEVFNIDENVYKELSKAINLETSHE